MTNKERYINCALGKPVDRLPFTIHFGPWRETMEAWREKNPELENDCWLKGPGEGFGYDEKNYGIAGHVNHLYYPGFKAEILEENERTIIRRDGLGQIVECMKHSTIPKILRSPVETMEDWETIKREKLNPDDPERFPENWKELAENINKMDRPIQVGCYPCGLFGTLRDLMGVEGCLIAFYDDPDLVHDIMDSLTDFWLALYEKISKDVKIDIIHIWEDMSGKQGSLISPAMIREFMSPNYKRIKKFADDHGIPLFVVDTDGDVEELIPVFHEAGVDLIMPMEVVAGCDVVDLRKKYPYMAFEGGIDKMQVALGKEATDKELDRISPLFSQTGFIPMFDHLIPPEVSWEDYCYYVFELKKRIFSEK